MGKHELYRVYALTVLMPKKGEHENSSRLKKHDVLIPSRFPWFQTQNNFFMPSYENRLLLFQSSTTASMIGVLLRVM